VILQLNNCDLRSDEWTSNHRTLARCSFSLHISPIFAIWVLGGQRFGGASASDGRSGRERYGVENPVDDVEKYEYCREDTT